MQPDNFLIQTIDKLVQETYTPTQPGVAVIVVKLDLRKSHLNGR